MPYRVRVQFKYGKGEAFARTVDDLAQIIERLLLLDGAVVTIERAEE